MVTKTKDRVTTSPRQPLTVEVGDAIGDIDDSYTVAWGRAKLHLVVTNPKGIEYVGFYNHDGRLTCNCPSFTFSQVTPPTCKHIEMLATFLEESGPPSRTHYRIASKLWHDTYCDPARQNVRRLRRARQEAEAAARGERVTRLEDLFPKD